METKLTFDLLPVLSVLLVLAAWYIPKFKDWFKTLCPEHKQLFMLVALALVDLVVVVLSALGFLSVYHGPSWREWVWYPLVDFSLAMITNSGAYVSTKHLLGEKTVG